MIRRHRRILPATVVALVLLAAVVALVASCVQLLLGQAPLIPFGTIVAAAARPWSSVAVISAGAVSAALGLVLLGCAWTRGAATVVPLAPTGHHSAGATRRSLRRAVAATAHSVDGVHRASATVSPRRVRARVRTPLRDPGDLDERVRAAIDDRLGQIALARTPRTRVRVIHDRSS